MRKRHIFSNEEIAWLKRNRNLTSKDAAEKFNKRFSCDVDFGAIKRARHKYRILSGVNSGQFKPGSTPSPLAGAKAANSTSFKKGIIPVSTKAIGTEAVMADGYVYVKVAEPNHWLMKHHMVWIENNGPIPKNHIIRFIDNNKSNFSPGNLIAISRREHVFLSKSKLKETHDELKPILINICKLKSLIYEKMKG